MSPLMAGIRLILRLVEEFGHKFPSRWRLGAFDRPLTVKPFLKEKMTCVGAGQHIRVEVCAKD